MAATSVEGRGFRTTGSERRLVTVLFADIVSSSVLVGGRDPEDADESLLGILQVLVDAVHRYRGMVGQVLGDGVLAVFGAPAALEDHALRACLAAQDMVNTARTGHPAGDGGAAAGTLQPFSVRIGIASGEVLSQVIECDAPWRDYRAVGECVHLAAKLQQSAPRDGVLLSAGTLDLARASLTTEPARPLVLAPEVPPYAAHRLVSARASRVTATDLVASRTAPFVGREAELRLLAGALERARNASGGAMLVIGDAGIGKSRLVGEFLRAHCGADDGAVDLVEWPQAPLRRPGEPDDLERVALSLAALAGRRSGGDGVAEVCAAAGLAAGSLAESAVGDLMGRPPVDPMWNGIDLAQRLSFAIEGLAAVAVEHAVERPVVLLVEDAHWASPVMARLLDTVAHSVAGSRLLLLATARPDEPTGWSGVPRMPRLDLNALSPAQTAAFLDHWLGRDPSLTPLKERVARRSEGVPLYLEESLRALESAGAIAGVEGAYRIVAPDRVVDLPASVRGLLAARIDALPADARATLRAAAVVGPTFDVGLLGPLLSVPPSVTMKALADLERSGFMHRSRLMPNLEFTFHHALVQEVAYAGIARRERQSLHARIVVALRKRRDHDLPGRLEALAHHASCAEIWPLAYVYGRFAGQRAEARSKLADATQRFADALNALAMLPASRRNTLRRIDIKIGLARSLIPQGIQDAGREQVAQARQLAADAGDDTRLACASSLLASYLWVYGDLDEAIALSRDALARLGPRHSLHHRVPVLVRLAGALAEKGAYQDACATIREAGRLIADGPEFGRYGLTAIGSVIVHSLLARYLAELGRYPDSVEAGHRALETADASGHAFSRITANLYLGLAHLTAGAFEPAIRCLEDGVAVAEAIRSQVFQPLLLGGLGYAFCCTDRLDEGLTLLRASREQIRILRHGRQLPQVLAWLADATLRTGNAHDAAALAEEAVHHARESGQQADEAAAHLVAAMALHQAATRAPARSHLEAARSLADTLGLIPLAERCRAERQRQEGTRRAVSA